MSRLRRLRRDGLGLVLFSLVLACAGEAEEAGEAEAGEEVEEQPLPPSFLDLETTELVVSAQETTDITFAVGDLQPDTLFEFDGEGHLPGAGAPAWLDSQRILLHLPLGGALVTGTHELALRHVVDSETLRSQVLTLEVVASEPGTLVSTLNPESFGPGDQLLTHGQGIAVALGLVDSGSETISIRAGAWSSTEFELELPGVEPSAGIEAGARVDLSIATPPDARWVVASWLSGDQAFARIIEIDGPGQAVADAGPVLTLWDLDDPGHAAALGPHQSARLDSLALLERTMVLGVEARRDAEAASPGDRLLVTRYLAASGDPADAVLLRGPGGTDLDGLGQARAWTGIFERAALSVRVDLSFARRLSLADNGLPGVEDEAYDPLAAVPADSVWLRSADAALGSRHVFSLELDGGSAQLRVIRLDRWRTSEPEEAGNEDDASESTGVGSELFALSAIPTAAPMLTAIDGVATVLVPLGPDEDLVALRSTGSGATLESIAGLRCDGVGVASPGDDGVGDTLPLACLREGELYLGALGVQ